MVVKSYAINDSREYIADNEVTGSTMSLGDVESQNKSPTTATDDKPYEPYDNRNVKHPTT